MFALAWLGGAPDSRMYLEEALAIHEARGDQADVAQMLHANGCLIALEDNDDLTARTYFEESLKRGELEYMTGDRRPAGQLRPASTW